MPPMKTFLLPLALGLFAALILTACGQRVAPKPPADHVVDTRAY